MHIKIERILKEFKGKIQALYGSRLKTIFLYGSLTRGNAGEDSDIDVVVVLKGDVTPGREIDRMVDIITEMNLKYNTLISVYPVSESHRIPSGSHRAVVSAFGERFIKPGIFPREMGKELNRAFEKRQLSDNEYTFVISRDEAKEMFEKGKTFTEEIILWLQEKGGNI